MMSRILVTGLGLAAVLAFGGVALAEETAAHAPPPVEEQLAWYEGTEYEGQVECRRVQRTGTNIPWTVCLPDEEWEQIRLESRAALERLMYRGIDYGG